MINKSILKSCHAEGFEEEEVYDAYKIFFGTLVSEPRLKMVNLLRRGKKNVSEIAAELGADQTSVSHDLSRLKQCGFVVSEVDGKFRYYKLNEETTVAIVLAVVLLLLFGGFGMMGFGGWGMMNWFYPDFGFSWIFMLVIRVLVIVALVLFILWLIRQLNSGGKK